MRDVTGSGLYTWDVTGSGLYTCILEIKRKNFSYEKISKDSKYNNKSMALCCKFDITIQL